MLRVAVVEDEAVVRRTIQSLFEGRGYAVDTYPNVTQAREALVHSPPDLLVTDVGLPDGDGLNLVAHLREVHRIEFPIVVVTGMAAEEDFRRAYLAGASDCITKPFTSAELLAKCEVHLSRVSDSPTRAIRSGLPRDAQGLVFRRYRIECLAGKGSSSQVYRAFCTQTQRKVALKVLNAAGGDEARLRFLREIYTLSAIEHDHVVRVLDFGTERGRFYYAMEEVAGPTLRALVRGGERPGPGELLELLRRLGGALAVLHQQGILHRDLSPHNVLLRGGRFTEPVLIDFGLAKQSFDHGLTANELLLGTPGYLDPALLVGDAGPRSDLFSLGALAVFACTGADPFHQLQGLERVRAMARRPVPIPAHLPPRLRELLAAMTCLEPELRPASAEEVLAELDELEARAVA
jgi:DNA-binding response OmpR family regulator